MPVPPAPLPSPLQSHLSSSCSSDSVESLGTWMHTYAIGAHAFASSSNTLPLTPFHRVALPHPSNYRHTHTRSHGQVEEPHQPQPVEQEPPQWDQGPRAPASPQLQAWKLAPCVGERPPCAQAQPEGRAEEAPRAHRCVCRQELSRHGKSVSESQEDEAQLHLLHATTCLCVPYQLASL
ncbi:ribosomal protein L29, putative [Leishmania tarentolae]|uniref:Ribosomal protein L29, putative n=1 Tax=Leishmania tarentolae TaxID=5689 RepID=A0A640L0W6_LEITA|nr:ribosomal protein L29, putative [Leishmania tarentolae]